MLRDDWKKSIDLTTNIMFFFFCFSTFSDFHHLLTKHKVWITLLCVCVYVSETVETDFGWSSLLLLQLADAGY